METDTKNLTLFATDFDDFRAADFDAVDEGAQIRVVARSPTSRSEITVEGTVLRVASSMYGGMVTFETDDGKIRRVETHPEYDELVLRYPQGASAWVTMGSITGGSHGVYVELVEEDEIEAALAGAEEGDRVRFAYEGFRGDEVTEEGEVVVDPYMHRASTEGATDVRVCNSAGKYVARLTPGHYDDGGALAKSLHHATARHDHRKGRLLRVEVIPAEPEDDDDDDGFEWVSEEELVDDECELCEEPATTTGVLVVNTHVYEDAPLCDAHKLPAAEEQEMLAQQHADEEAAEEACARAEIEAEAEMERRVERAFEEGRW